MMHPSESRSPNDARWHEALTRGHPAARGWRWICSRLPGSPRCKFCRMPFGGIGARIVGVFGWRPSRKNPSMCAV